MKEFVAEAKLFIKHNWKGALTFFGVLAFIAAYIAIIELYQYLAINVFPNW